MTSHTLFFLFVAFTLLILIPFFVIRDLKRDKKLTDIFISNLMLLVIFLVSIGEVLRTILSTESMYNFNQILFLFIVIFLVSPAIFILFYHLNSDIKIFSNPKEYKYYWAYKIRYVILTIQTVLFIIAIYRFYLMYIIVFK